MVNEHGDWCNRMMGKALEYKGRLRCEVAREAHAALYRNKTRRDFVVGVWLLRSGAEASAVSVSSQASLMTHRIKISKKNQRSRFAIQMQLHTSTNHAGGSNANALTAASVFCHRSDFKDKRVLPSAAAIRVFVESKVVPRR